MKHTCVTQRILGPLVAGGILSVLAMPAGAVDLTSPDGNWTFSVNGNINVDYIYSDCQKNPVAIGGGLTCGGAANGNTSVSNVGNGLLPAAIVFGVKTTQDGFDIGVHFGFYPGIATNDGGSPNLQASGGPTNTALGTTGLDIRQVYLTFGNKDMGTFLLGRQIGLFGADVILNDMTLPGVGAPGSAATSAPSNTTLGGIGFGYIYTDWLAQMDYTTPDFAGFNITGGIFDPLNSLTDAGVPQPKKSPGFHAKATYTSSFSDTVKLYGSVAFLTQQQYNQIPGGGLLPPVNYNYTGDGVDVFVKLDVGGFEAFGYYYKAKGLGTTGLFVNGSFADGQTRDSEGYLAQVTYKFGAVKLGVNYGESKLDTANSTDASFNPGLVESNKKGTIGAYWSLTKNLTLLAEASRTKSEAQAGGSNQSNTFNIGAFVGF